MNNVGLIGVTSIVAATLCMALGSIAPAIGEARAIIQALNSMAQQPDESGPVSRTLFIGLAMIESIAIYCFVISIILIFTNPFWTFVSSKTGG